MLTAMTAISIATACVVRTCLENEVICTLEPVTFACYNYSCERARRAYHRSASTHDAGLLQKRHSGRRYLHRHQGATGHGHHTCCRKQSGNQHNRSDLWWQVWVRQGGRVLGFRRHSVLGFLLDETAHFKVNYALHSGMCQCQV